MLFGRIELREARSKNVRLPVITLWRNGILLHVVFNQPDFGAVILWSVTDENNLEERLIGLEFDRMVELGDERPEPFEEGDTDLLQVLSDLSFTRVAGIGGRQTWKITVQANGLGLRGDLPFRSAEENADVAAVNGGDSRRDGLGLEGMINRGEDDGVVGDMDDGAAAGQIGDDFVFLRWHGESSGQSRQEK